MVTRLLKTVETNGFKVRLYKDAEANKLPIGFKRVEYLESTGTQYINTGVILSSTDKVEALAEYTGAPTQGSSYIFGTYGGSKNFGINADLPSSSSAFYGVWYNQGTITASTPKPEINTKYKVEVSSNGIYINDTLFRNVSGTFTGSNPAYLFWANGTGQPKSIMRLYYTKIWNNTTLVRNYIPALDTTNTPCMYDTVTQTAFYNQGTEQFTYGAVIPNKVRLPQSTEIRFPKGYTEVEYLESDSTAYIDTGVSGANNNLKIEMGFSYSKFTAYGYFFSNYESEQHNTTRFLLDSSSNSRALAYINTKSQNGAIYSVNCTKDNFHTFVLTKTSVSIDGNTTTNNDPPVGTANTKNIILFNRGAGSYAEKRDIGMRCYYFRIYDNDKLIRYFIPALDPNGKPCMWDVVTKQPFYNQGTGEFSYGRSIQQVEYLESSGTQYIDTGVLPTQLTKAKLDIQFTNVNYKQAVLGSNNGASGDAGWNNLFGTNENNSTAKPTYFWCQWGASYDGPVTKDTNKHTHTFERNGNTSWTYSVDSSSITITSGITTQTTPKVLYLFACNNNGTLYRQAKAKVYQCQIWNNGILVRDYASAIDSNNVGFMFDKVTHTIFDNIGTGSFTYGSPIPNKIRD